MNVARKIFYAQFGLDSASKLINPLIKLLMLATPIAIVLYQSVARLAGAPRFAEIDLIGLAFLLNACSNLALSGRKRSLFIYRTLRFGAVCALVVVIHTDPPEYIKNTMEFISHTAGRMYVIGPLLSFLDIHITLETWAIILLIWPMRAAARNITTRDALWIGRTFLWGRFFIAYMVLIVVHAVLGSVLPVRLTTAWESAQKKGRLSKSPYLARRARLVRRWKDISLTFSRNLVFNNSTLSISIISLLKQRRMFAYNRSDAHARNMSTEDFGVVVLIVGVVIAYLFALVR